MRKLLVVWLMATVVASCAQEPGSLFDATEQATELLEETAAEVLTAHSYNLDIGGPTSAWCDEPDGTPDHTRIAVDVELTFDLQSGDDPVAMAARIVDYWRSTGHRVDAEGWGTSSVAGSFSSDDGHSFGFAAVDHRGPAFDVLVIDALTACYPRP
jgi:hypothetical protein